MAVLRIILLCQFVRYQSSDNVLQDRDEEVPEG